MKLLAGLLEKLIDGSDHSLLILLRHLKIHRQGY
jgi:hypothetical protein